MTKQSLATGDEAKGKQDTVKEGSGGLGGGGQLEVGVEVGARGEQGWPSRRCARIVRRSKCRIARCS